jgi:hypothetical protein
MISADGGLRLGEESGEDWITLKIHGSRQAFNYMAYQWVFVIERKEVTHVLIHNSLRDIRR